MKKKLSLCVAACALVLGGGTARAQTAVIGNVKPTEMRIAVADAAWSTVWTSLRVEQSGPFALVVPLPDGAYVDQSSDAWFEALEGATAPRVLPPEGLNPYCPGESGVFDPYDVAGNTAHQESLAPQAIALVDDAAGVASWATSHGLSLGGALQMSLANVPAKRFLCVAFASPGGDAITATLRVSSPAGLPALPFSITRAAQQGKDLRVSAWLLGGGRGDLLGTSTLMLPAAEISWDAKTQTSDYVASRDALLAPSPDAVTLESTGHAPFASSVPFANDTATIDPLVTTYFERAAQYGSASDSAPCIQAAKPLFASASVVSPACPRGDLASPALTCTAKPPTPGEIDATALACGPGADDLAIALAGASPKAAWITRRTFVIAQGAAGKDRPFAFGAGAPVQPIVEAGSVDVGDCGGGSGGSAGAGGTTGTTTTVTGTNPNHTGGNGQGGAAGSYGAGAYDSGAGYGYGGYDTGEVVSDVACACASTVGTAETTSDGCDGTSTGSDTTVDDGCSGDGSDSAADACSGDSAGSSSDACSGDSAGSTSDACSGDSASSSDCSVSATRGRGATPPRFSILTMAALAFLIPWRRRGSRTKRLG